MNNLNFIIKPYDPLDEALQLFKQFNENPEAREYTESQLTSLIVHRVKQHDRRVAEQSVASSLVPGLVPRQA